MWEVALTKHNSYIAKLKAEIFLQKVKSICWGVFAITIVMVMILLFSEIRKIDPNWMVNSTLSGVIGTLLGAFVGGFFTLRGSIWVNAKQQQATEDIRKRDNIYAPLYNELMGLQSRELKENPYPRKVLFKKAQQFLNSHYPELLEWGNIKSDSRFLEIPEELKLQMEKLNDSIHTYLEWREKVEPEIDKIIRDVFMENNVTDLPDRNKEQKVIKYLLQDEYSDIYGIVINAVPDIEGQLRSKINNTILEKCNNDPYIFITRESYNNWIAVQQETIDLLGLMIRRINTKFKG